MFSKLFGNRSKGKVCCSECGAHLKKSGNCEVCGADIDGWAFDIACKFAKKYKRDFYVGKKFSSIGDSLMHTEVYLKSYRQVKEKAERILHEREGDRMYFGRYHDLCDIEKQIFKEEYDIDWLSPDDLDIYVCRD